MSDHIQQHTTPHGHKGVTTGHSHGHGGPASPFTEAEWKEFHKSDIGAGGAVIVLMTAIFSIGLLLYTVVAFFVAA